jgi:2-oxoacid:acceptor oxidoreductase gamma subunit (pyruvate/2-ketoisovalerate family)/2-oxoacid:acceptor oxidoreductase delta subunit (pyruvate/2-ketoisovalerate family)
MLYEIRFHGRGGQGAVMAAQAVAEAAIIAGLEAQAFPFFGAERRGAPVTAFARISDEPICVKTNVYTPDMLVVMDESLVDIEPVALGLRPEGVAIINTKRRPEEVDLGIAVRCYTVDATNIALELLKAPIVNTSILGAMARGTDIISIADIKNAIRSRFGEKLGAKAGEVNAAAAQAAYDGAMEGRSKAERALTRKRSWQPTWQEMPPGVALHCGEKAGIEVGPGSMRNNRTGTWRTRTPFYVKEKCVRCLRCWFICPDSSVKREADGHINFDYDHCKGCGMCAAACPGKAIEMRKGGSA